LFAYSDCPDRIFSFSNSVSVTSVVTAIEIC
jgi:hypothetical protein